ncbi:PulJ/GspJ family protein [Flavobacterium litorale]|uniref:Prepilin-type N-terminal cleavage/methylation domain-containing protein n=1 Tax=Flavobacterium litorale TaxID=2856519 RepID=A0ABX8VC96_9FLAO|nr:prepilin-type N-terminal cleavage/methylation domain-containing protein [Flavobacterium litorale]QYJ68274.1 prepilin-type N-terminal cleavage/methylation domain-containing protein [Flavobacterium litorale]
MVQPAKIKSFTLSEMLVVMIITAIVVGIAFSVLRLVQKQIITVERNFQKTTEISLFEQRIWQDYNQHNKIVTTNNKIILTSVTDTVIYNFSQNYVLRNTDTINVKLAIDKFYYLGKEVKSGFIDAVSISAENEIPNHTLFVSTQYDATHYMNNDGI